MRMRNAMRCMLSPSLSRLALAYARTRRCADRLRAGISRADCHDGPLACHTLSIAALAQRSDGIRVQTLTAAHLREERTHISFIGRLQLAISRQHIACLLRATPRLAI